MRVFEQILQDIDTEIEKQKGADGRMEGTAGWHLFSTAMERAKDIVRKHMNDNKCGECSRRKWYQKGYDDGEKSNDGWIPVEKALPDEYENVLVWYESYGIGYQYDGCWSGDVQGVNARCIAWQPLPEPYKSKGE